MRIASGCVQRSQPLVVGRVHRRPEDIQAQADRPQVPLLHGHEQRRLVVASLRRRGRQWSLDGFYRCLLVYHDPRGRRSPQSERGMNPLRAMLQRAT